MALPNKRRNPTSKENQVDKIDIAIIGGGIAGLYTAWRLQGNPTNKDKKRQFKKSDEKLKVRLYEAAPEVGGRLCSVRIPGVAVPAELGAMRYSTRHKLLHGLIEHLQLSTQTFKVPAATYYIRGRRLLPDTIRNNSCRHCAASIPFNLRDHERGKLPDELIEQAIWEALGQLNFHGLEDDDAARIRAAIGQRSLNSDDWRKIKNHGQYRDVHLYNMGFWNLLQHYLSNEAFLLAHDGLGYESIVGNWNAAEALQWFVADFARQEYFMLCKGLRKLATKLEELIDPARSKGISKGELIKTDYKLKNILLDMEDNDYPWQLGFKVKGSAEEAAEEDREELDKPDVWVRARSIILSLPKNALGKLVVSITGKKQTVGQPNRASDFPVEWKEWSRFKKRIEVSIRSHSLFKLFLVYHSPWWTGDPLPQSLSGRVCTDLPIRQIYYFGPDWIKNHADSEESERARKDFKKLESMETLSLVMASYSDAHYVSFWRPLSPRMRTEAYSEEHDLRPYQPRPHLYQDSSVIELMKIAQKYGAPERMVQKVQEQLAEVHGVDPSVIPAPIVAIYRDWGQASFDGGWHTWEVHEKSWELAQQFLQPFNNRGLYICGEAFSTEQGWIEGALKTSEHVLLKLKESINYSRPPSFPDEDKFEEYIEYKESKKAKILKGLKG